MRHTEGVVLLAVQRVRLACLVYELSVFDSTLTSTRNTKYTRNKHYLEPHLGTAREHARLEKTERRTWTLRALRPIDLPTSSRMAVVGKRLYTGSMGDVKRASGEHTWASKAWSTADWCGVVKVRVRFFLPLG